MILDKIITQKQEELKQKWPGRSQEIPGSLTLSTKSLEENLSTKEPAFILECKKASPSKGLIRPDFNAVKIAKKYSPFASAISVLTDEKFFSGSLDYLKEVSKTVSVPVLCKDFILEPFQIVEARKKGADAVLLMLSVLNDEEFIKCLNTAKALSMDALVEIRNEEELKRALKADVKIIGINNRNFDDLSVDLNNTMKLAPKIPSKFLIVSESGYSDYNQIKAARNYVDAFLVGSSLMAKDNITKACGELIYGRVKVCGITSKNDALEVARRGLCFGGLIFVSNSPRYVTPQQALEISEGVPLDFVGVFANEAPEKVIQTASKLGLSVVQLHGEESPEYVMALRNELPDNIEIWKSLAVKNSIPSLIDYKDCRILLDNKTGGSGKTFNWALLNSLCLDNTILAGGINPENVANASDFNPWCLDVNSGVELAPGQKDFHKLDQLLSNLKGLSRSSKKEIQ